MFEKSLIVPRVNINGTSKKQLVEQYMEVVRHLNMTLAMMGPAAPHGRDYQTFPNHQEVVFAATEAWRERALMLSQFRKELEEMAFEIDQQG